MRDIKVLLGFSNLAIPLISMLKTSQTQSAENLPLDIAEDAEVGSGDNSGDNETVKRLPLSKKSNIPTG